jgi:tetratricopeptide (TPR) repeat protein
MRPGLRGGHLSSVLSIGIALSIGFLATAAPRENFAQGDRPATAGQEALSQNPSRQKADYAAAGEAFLNGISREPGSVAAWMKWADFDLERFRILDLELRSAQSGMAVVLRFEAQGFDSGPETREELLRQSATADPEQQGIWGELGVEQVRRGMPVEATATLKTALERQPKDSWTLRLQAITAAAQGHWAKAEVHLRELGVRSPAVLRSALKAWPRNLLPKEELEGGIWECARKESEACLEKIKFPASEGQDSEDQLFAEERWEQLAALAEPPREVPAAWFRRGVALAELNDCARAIPALERGLGAGGETAAYWLELCYASEAERATARIGALGNEAVFHRVRGDFLVRVTGDTQSATEEYEKARKLQPRDAVLAERVAQAYQSLGEMNQAKQAAREALALDPRRPVAVRLLVSIAMDERDYPAALEFLNKMLVMRSNDAWARVEMGVAYAQTGQPQQALAYLEPLLAAGYPDERGALHGMLAGVLRKLGREQEAQTAAAEANRLSNLFQQHGQKGVDDHQ